MLNPEEKTEVQRKGIERPQPFISPSVREEQFLSHSVLPSTSPPTDVLFQTEKKILVLVSGNGSNLQALLDAEKIGNLAGARIALVISDRPGVYALERAQRAGKPALVEEPNRYLPKEKRRLELSNRILERAREFMVHYIVLAGFLSILRGPILEEYRGRIINIHPSLLPKYGGPGMYGYKVHEAVLTAGESESGCTVHVVDEGTDTGPIILQRRVPVFAHDTPESLAERIHREEHIAIVEAVQRLVKEIP